MPCSVGDAQKHGASLRWEPPSSDGGATPDVYRLQHTAADGAAAWVQSYEGERCDCGVGGLLPATAYMFRAAAHNRAGVRGRVPIFFVCLFWEPPL